MLRAAPLSTDSGLRPALEAAGERGERSGERARGGESARGRTPKRIDRRDVTRVPKTHFCFRARGVHARVRVGDVRAPEKRAPGV